MWSLAEAITPITPFSIVFKWIRNVYTVILRACKPVNSAYIIQQSGRLTLLIRDYSIVTIIVICLRWIENWCCSTSRPNKAVQIPQMEIVTLGKKCVISPEIKTDLNGIFLQVHICYSRKYQIIRTLYDFMNRRLGSPVNAIP